MIKEDKLLLTKEEMRNLIGSVWTEIEEEVGTGWIDIILKAQLAKAINLIVDKLTVIGDEEIQGLRPKPLDCGRCGVGGDVCKLTELDKARCWARKVGEAQLQHTIKEIKG